MNIYLTKGTRPNKPFLLSVEDKTVIQDGEIEFKTSQTSNLVTGVSCVCTEEVFELIKNNVGTMSAPALLENSTSTPFKDRQNVYIEKGALKIIS